MDVIGVVGEAAERGFGFGLLLASFWFGFRHGIDWDHIAAITDITSSQEERRHALLFGTLYALGHASVVLLLGVLAIVFGDLLPEGVDETMGKVVGVTLLLLGVYVVYSLVRHGRDFRLRSRWMLVFSGVRRAKRWVRRRVRRGAPVPGTGVPASAAPSPLLTMERDEELPAEDPALWHHGHHGRLGHHHHERPEPDDTFVNYGRGTSFGVGMIHGVGAETPTQVLIFLGAAASSPLVGIAALLAFIAGLLASNSLITLGSSYGFLQASRNFAIYAAIGILTAIFSLVIGTIFVTGSEHLLPAFFGS